MCVCVCLCVSVCVCVSVHCGKRKKKSVCVCVCVCGAAIIIYLLVLVALNQLLFFLFFLFLFFPSYFFLPSFPSSFMLLFFLSRRISFIVYFNLFLFHPQQNRDASIEEWRQGLQALASAGDHVNLKLSMMWYMDRSWDSDGSVVPALFKEAIAMFGPKRCMFASNYPVDRAEGVAMERLIVGFDKLISFLSEEDQKQIYSKTAKSVYRL